MKHLFIALAVFATFTSSACLDLPNSFDARKKWGSSCPVLHDIKTQEHCGSCAFLSIAQVVSDRHCIATGSSIPFSAQWLMSCVDYEKEPDWVPCNGIPGNMVFDAVVEHGMVPETCLPYSSDDWVTPACPATCNDGTAFNKRTYTIKEYGIIDSASDDIVTAIQEEIFLRGPLFVAIDVYSDFNDYATGVYTCNQHSDEEPGAHAVRIVGWGVEDGIPYWLCTNTWGREWGSDGAFKIRRGVNECGIEGGFSAFPIFDRSGWALARMWAGKLVSGVSFLIAGLQFCSDVLSVKPLAAVSLRSRRKDLCESKEKSEYAGRGHRAIDLKMD
ncbi:Papain family cysteine protease [Carpediemonas membranifera]|uniref:Papain family cysteine protease n=1 Tax=Carpediemonas membranifera TaxID=201153 RepID=A0A8J6E3K5_9EUKA|nr:Papain family cysteine protease [Carpediemonas membranifera]|eukprot:KAG9393307.1 Papain family cysteine protease [Carpediemonas membranifera]